MIDISYVNDGLRENKAEFIKKSEELYLNQIGKIEDRLSFEKKGSIVLLSGPSSSGKTTTASIIAEYCKKNNIKANVVSLDDFYLDRLYVPLNKNGERDLETIHSLDLNRLKENLEELTKKGRAEFPIFDFIKEKRSEKARVITHDENTVLILEGIHSLNPLITKENSNLNFIKVYISVENGYVNGEKTISNNKVRFLRRLIRDYYYRNSSISETFSMWEAVREGEKKYITPYKDMVDFKINSNICYEPGIFKKYLNYFMKEIKEDEKEYLALKEYTDFYNNFEIVDKKEIPKETLLQEFLWEDIVKYQKMWYNILE